MHSANRSKSVVLASLVVTLGVAGAFLISERSIAANPEPGSAPVNIVGPLPLPVTGTLGLAPGGSVTVANPATNPVLVSNINESLREPFQFASVFIAFSSGGSNSNVVTVPANKRLVIEHVSAAININSQGGLATAGLGISGSNVADFIACQATGSTSSNLSHFYSCSVQTKFYAAPGQTVDFGVTSADGNGTGFYKVFVSGYYVPAP